ncbi:UNVERIFIED_CONTAM: Phosphatidylinositol 4-kinase gamma 4 [Sesamum latifolium]|uniref:1-phosphatidylinositol 4-kinase n=1 Tax=Sesamum latifolium TaxID=2727402 RepID=A0AAW2X1Q1_9LAMI
MSAVDVAWSPVCEETARSSAVCLNRRLGFSSSESIVIYITVGGSAIPMRVMESDSIASVKLRIQACKGFVVKKQKLVFGGRELSRTDSLVKDYGITSGNVLHLALRISDLLLISVRTTCGKELEFHIDRHRNVGYLKRRIAKKGKGFLDLKDPEVFCCGEKLEDQRLIHDISNNTDAVIHLVVQKSAKVRTKAVERDVELSVVAPNWNEKTNEAHNEKNPPRELRVLSRTPPPLRKIFS